MNAETENAKALQMIRDCTDGALENSSLVEAVAILISQRDNARHYNDSFRQQLLELSRNFLS